MSAGDQKSGDEHVPSADVASTAEPQAAPELVRKTTHEVDANDMFGSAPK